MLPAYKMTLTIFVILLACLLASSRALEASNILGEHTAAVKEFFGPPEMFMILSTGLALVTLLTTIVTLREKLRTEAEGG